MSDELRIESVVSSRSSLGALTPAKFAVLKGPETQLPRRAKQTLLMIDWKLGGGRFSGRLALEKIYLRRFFMELPTQRPDQQPLKNLPKDAVRVRN